MMIDASITFHRHMFRRSSVAVFLFLALASAASAKVTLTFTSKTITPDNAGMFFNGGMVTVEVVKLIQPGNIPGLPPNFTPTFALDFYEEDLFDDDAKGNTDLSDGSTGVTVAGGGWTPGGAIKDTFSPPQLQQTWIYKWNLPGFFLSATDPDNDPPEPYAEVDVTLPGGVQTDITAAANLPSAGMTDLGVMGIDNMSNVAPLIGEPIAAFSRGYDEISGLQTIASPVPAPSDAAIYFSADQATTVGSPGISSGPGQLYVFDALGQVWEESAFGGVSQPQIIDYLNVNTGVPTSGVAAPDFFLVRDNSSTIEYASTGDPDTTSTFLNVNTGGLDIAALAVEDVGVRGTWDAGDAILYAVENSSVISKLTFGGVAAPLTANGVTFDGTAALSYDFLDPSLLVGQTMSPGFIHSLSVASAIEFVKPVPSDRVGIDFSQTVIPEPSSWLLVCGGLLLVGSLRRGC